jgi:TRAP-type C4-dicarboxylate transport system permease large subunit
MAGIAPGLMLGVALWVTWWYLVRKEDVKPPPRKSLAEVWAALKGATFALGMPIIVIVGLKFGVFTPTEAAVVAAVYALVVSMFIYRELKFSQLYTVFLNAARTTAVIISLLQPFLDNPKLLMAMMMLLVILVGTAMDMTPTILILTPVLMPIVKAAGIDPVYFGVLFIINNAIGLITPPVGTVLNTVAGVGKLSMDTVTRGVWPFMLAQFAILFLLVLFPELVMVPARWFYN